MRKYLYIVFLETILCGVIQAQSTFTVPVFYSQKIKADSVVVTCVIKVPTTVENAKGITSAITTVYKKGKIVKSRGVSKVVGEELIDDISLKYLPETYYRFLNYSHISKLPKGRSFSVPFVIRPTSSILQLKDDEISFGKSELLKLSESLCKKSFTRKQGLHYTSSKDIMPLRNYALCHISDEVISKSDTLIIVEIVCTCQKADSGDRTIFIYDDTSNEIKRYEITADSVMISACGSQSGEPEIPAVRQFIADIYQGNIQSLVKPFSTVSILDTHKYVVLLLTKKNGVFVPELYEDTNKSLLYLMD